MRERFARGLAESSAAPPCLQDDSAAPPPARTPAPTPEARAWPPRGTAHRAQTVVRAAARPNRTRLPWGDHLRRVAGFLPRVLGTRVGYRDPLFERPDLIEDDYYRLRNQPRG